MDRITLRAAASVVIAAVIGLLLVRATDIGFAFSVVVPALCFLQKRRIDAFLVAFGYYGAASSILIPGAKSFFGPGTTLQLPIALWGTASLLLALPFATLWSSNHSAARWRAPLALLASVPPPLGIIGWANPLTAAGVLFPGMGWLGLFGILTFAASSPVYMRASVIALMVCSLMANVFFPGFPVQPAEWEAIDTTFGDTGGKHSNILKQFETAQYIQQRALESHARIIVFPESVIPRWTEATEIFWEPTLSRLASTGKIVLFGAGIDIDGTAKYRNMVVMRGAQKGEFAQRIPIPIGMWQPLEPAGVPLHLDSASVTMVGRHRVAVLICYEQFLTWPILQSLFYRPTVLLGVANLYWARETRIPQVQSSLLRVWARLFRVSMISVTNT